MFARFLVLACAVTALATAPAATAGAEPHLFDQLIRDIDQFAVGDPNINPQPFLASAEAAARANERGNDCAAQGALGALANKLEAHGIGDPNIRSDIAEIERAFPPGPC